MLTVEFRVFDEEKFSELMTRTREWLDHRRLEPTTFRYTFLTPGVLFRVDFDAETEASEFAEAFGGRVMSTVAPLAAG